MRQSMAFKQTTNIRRRNKRKIMNWFLYLIAICTVCIVIVERLTKDKF